MKPIIVMKYLIIFLLSITVNEKLKAQYYISGSIGINAAKYALDPKWHSVETNDTVYRKPNFIYGIGAMINYKNKYKLGFKINHSSRNYHFTNGGFEWGYFDEWSYKSLDMKFEILFVLVKYFDLGIVMQKSLYYENKLRFQNYHFLPVRTEFFNNLFGYTVGANVSHFNLSFTYMPHSKVTSRFARFSKLFPVLCSPNIQCELSYLYKLGDIHWPTKRKKVDCPTLGMN